MVPGIMVSGIKVLNSGKKEIKIPVVIIISHRYSVGVLDGIQADCGLNMAESLAGGTVHGNEAGKKE
jgi:sulfopyruvate decarboxylase TPP-binding subunit